jgi:hypothetical protein
MADEKAYCGICNSFGHPEPDWKLAWQHRLEVAMARNGESQADIVRSEPPSLANYEEVCPDGDALFTVWTHDRVYFPYEYDGYTSVHWLFRNPNDIRTPQCGFSGYPSD